MNGGNARRMSSPENSSCPAAKRGGCSQEKSFPPRTSQSGSEFRSGWCISSWRRSLLVPAIEDPATGPAGVSALDDSQMTAARAEAGPHLIEAGPGTGKTRTLIARIEWLLEQGVDPTSILVLTFSNKAAEELRERVAASSPDAAPAIWAGTFHAFGLEILRKFGDRLGLDPNLRVADPGDALLLLEEELPSLPLKHYLRLYEPAFALRDMLTAISRAKDELIGPEGYRELGEEMLAVAGDDGDEVEKAEKAIEVAEVFAVYEGLLEARGVVDFADLIVKPVRLLQDDSEVGEALRAQYEWILVDEYQDVNRASGVLLKLLAGVGTERLGGGRRAPVHLPVSRRVSSEHQKLRGRLRRREAALPGDQLPVSGTGGRAVHGVRPGHEGHCRWFTADMGIASGPPGW